MQEILTWTVVVGAAIILVYKTTQSLKSFKKSDSSCNGCGGACCGCPVAPANRKAVRQNHR